ncbi:hypothetical protein L345_16166, partial [Ophiophagus hannah]
MQFMDHQHAFVETGLAVHFAVLVPHEAKRLEAVVSYGGHLEVLQTHPHEDVVDGVQIPVFGGFVETLRQGPVHHEAPSARVRRVVGLAVQRVGDVVFVFLLANGPRLDQHVAHEEVSSFLILEELQDVLRTHKDVIVALEDVPDLVAVDVEPLQEIDFLQGDAQEEERLDFFPVQCSLLAPRPTDGFSAVVLSDDRLHHDQELNLAAAFLRVVDEDGEVATVPVKEELLEVGLQVSEPLLLGEVEVGRAVGGLHVPGRHSFLGGYDGPGNLDPLFPEGVGEGQHFIPFLGFEWLLGEDRFRRLGLEELAGDSALLQERHGYDQGEGEEDAFVYGLLPGLAPPSIAKGPKDSQVSVCRQWGLSRK